MASRITTKLGGRPFSIALRNKFKFIWPLPKSKSDKANRPIPTKPQLCLLICGLFPEDSSVPLEDWVLFARGLKFFQDVHDVIGAIHRVRDHIEFSDADRALVRGHIEFLSADRGLSVELRLEKDEYDNQYVKIPWGTHKITRLIASRFELVLGGETISKEWPDRNTYEHFYGLSLVLKRIRKHPLSLECPKLALLQLRYWEDSQILPIAFFDEMKELQVLSLDVLSLPHSLSMLRNLRALRLKVRKLENMFWIRGLINLEYLSVSTLSLTDVPREVGELSHLRFLDLSTMNIAYFPPGVLSRMLRLEELYMPSTFRRWGCRAREAIEDYDEWESSDDERSDEADDGERINACFSEIVSRSLYALQVCVPTVSILPKKSTIFKHIQQFKILVPKNSKYQSFSKGKVNELQLSGDSCDIKDSGICDLMRRTEDLSLIRVRNLKNVMYQLEDYEFLRLKKMIVTECDELEYLVDTPGKWILATSFWELKSLHLSMLPNLKEIWHGKKPTFLWLDNLREISIRFCPKLKYVFPLSMAKGLKQLQSIEILECDKIEGIFYQNKVDGKTNDSTIDWNSVINLHLHSLPKLIGFLVQKDRTDQYGVHDDQLHNKYVATNQPFIADENFTSRTAPSILNKQVSLFNKDVVSHTEMYCAFSSRLMKKRFEGLEKLKIAFCDELKVIFSFSGNHAASGVLESLKELEVFGLRNLMHIWFQVPPNITGFQNLQLLVLSECYNSYLFSPRVAKLLVKLQKIQISRCEKMEEIVSRESEKEVVEEIVFPRLKALELQYMPNLRIFYGGISAIKSPLLESLKLNECDKMESFAYGSLSTPVLEKVQLNGSLYSVKGDLNATIKWKQTPIAS